MGKKRKNRNREGHGRSVDFQSGLKLIAEREGLSVTSHKQEVKQSTPCKEHVKNIVPGRDATAPYNFIPLNTSVVEMEAAPSFDVYHRNKYTGRIEIEIETKTPLYIRDTLTEEQIREKEELENRGKKYINPDFYSPGGKIMIPGSSIRGMVRTLVEIVGFGNFGFFEKDRKYHYRSFADKSLDLRDKYVERMLTDDPKKGYTQKVKAGYVVHEGGNFFIKPAKEMNGCLFFRVEEDLVIKKRVLTEPMNIKRSFEDGKAKYYGNNRYRMGFKRVRFTYEPPKKHSNHSRPLYYANVIDICNMDQTIHGSVEGALVHSGWMRGSRPRGKHLHWVVGPPLDIKKEFLPGVIEDYKNDKNRHEEADLLFYFKENAKAEVPCFYIEEDGRIVSFGHTGIFRLAYDRKLNDFLPQSIQYNTNIDLAESIFGNETSFAGRLFFEDSVLQGNQNEAIMEEEIP